MDIKIFKKSLEILTEVFPNRKFAVSVYWELLKDLDDSRFLKAVKDVCSTTKEIYPDTNLIAIIREKACRVDHKLPLEAWQEVVSECSRVGARGNPEFSDEVIGKAVSCLGWENICLSEMPGIERSHFVKAYEQLTTRADNETIGIGGPVDKKRISEVNKLTEGIGGY